MTENKYLGKRTFKDMTTGEIVEFDYIQKKVQHNMQGGWRRVYLADFLEVLLSIGNAKIKVLEFMLSNLDSNNKLNMTMREVSKRTKISYQTTWDTFKEIEKAGLIKKVGTAWVVMPNFVSTFGSDKKNAKLLTEYMEYEPSLFDNVEENKLEKELEMSAERS